MEKQKLLMVYINPDSTVDVEAVEIDNQLDKSTSLYGNSTKVANSVITLAIDLTTNPPTAELLRNRYSNSPEQSRLLALELYGRGIQPTERFGVTKRGPAIND